MIWWLSVSDIVGICANKYKVCVCENDGLTPTCGVKQGASHFQTHKHFSQEKTSYRSGQLHFLIVDHYPIKNWDFAVQIIARWTCVGGTVGLGRSPGIQKYCTAFHHEIWPGEIPLPREWSLQSTAGCGPDLSRCLLFSDPMEDSSNESSWIIRVNHSVLTSWPHRNLLVSKGNQLS